MKVEWIPILAVLLLALVASCPAPAPCYNCVATPCGYDSECGDPNCSCFVPPGKAVGFCG